ncbi:uncharacterized protein LOC136079440 [Hydra vulgaris]|uniref:Uncharacterized protein LOC136079440 n=1 Tax=Hydra vulgaris TaxID=6087 RepID=A0ABM4BQ53_HYDVU
MGSDMKSNLHVALNYRPVSLTSVPCNVLEGFIRVAVTDHLQLHDALSQHQYDFVKKKACVTNKYFDNIHGMQVSNRHDIPHFSTAVDKVPHKTLLLKCEAYGISGVLLR